MVTERPGVARRGCGLRLRAALPRAGADHGGKRLGGGACVSRGAAERCAGVGDGALGQREARARCNTDIVDLPMRGPGTVHLGTAANIKVGLDTVSLTDDEQLNCPALPAPRSSVRTAGLPDRLDPPPARTLSAVRVARGREYAPNTLFDVRPRRQRSGQRD